MKHYHCSVQENYVTTAIISKKAIKNNPSVFIDPDLDFVSIKIAEGIETRSYLKDGFIFCEDKKGKIIEIQILNLSQLKAQKKSRNAKNSSIKRVKSKHLEHRF